jgi:sugar transferase EpsL
MVKRLFDIFVSGIFLLACIPIFIAIAILIWRFFGRPIVFSQIRPGLGGQPFRMFKFRSMLGTSGRTLSDAERLTPFGSLLRASSLDELLGLWNVLRGEMSLVGPRPLLMEYLDRYTPLQARRHEVRPGITGWAQVNGRNAISWEQKFELDVWYVEHQSFWLDVWILWLTVLKVIRGDGISAAGDATMPEFMGSTHAQS